MRLADPAYPPSNRAPLVWALGAAIPLAFLVVAQVFWYVLDGRLPWLHGLVAVATAVIGLIFVVIVPLWRFRVHRWEISPQAVYTRTGWLTQERRIAPISRVQTVDSRQGALMRLFGLASITVTTASAAGPITVNCLDADTARHVVARLTAITAATEDDAT